MNQPKVSVIIPVYKAEKDIARCCKALFAQTLDSIEYIFVDDCTPDNSLAVVEKVLEEYPHRKPFVKILHQPQNSGVSACRQYGLQNASGDYIIHCDSDDWPDEDMYVSLYNAAVAEGAEVVCCDYMVEYEGRSELVVFPDEYVTRPSFNTAPIEGAVWNKLISRQLIDRCGAEFYQGINLGEDFGFVTPCRVMSRKNAVVHKPMYHYNQLNLGSITHNYTRERFMQVVGLAERVDANMVSLGKAEEYERELCFLKFQAKAYFLMFREVQDLNLWKTRFPESNKYIWSYSYPLYVKVTGWMLAHNLTPVAKILLSLKTIITKH